MVVGTCCQCLHDTGRFPIQVLFSDTPGLLIALTYFGFLARVQLLVQCWTVLW